MEARSNFLMTIFAVMFAIIMVFPIYLLFVGSIRLPNEIFHATLFPLKVTLGSFVEVLEVKGFMRSIWNSFVVSTAVTVIALLFHAMSGYALTRFQFPGKQYIFAWMISTLMVPFSVVMIPLFMITKNFGMANSYSGLIVPMIFNAYGIFLFRQFYKGFPKELEEAAYMEGSTQAGTFFRIALPLSMPIIIPLTIGFFLFNWNNYLWPLIVNQKTELRVVQVALSHIVGGGYYTPWNVVLAAAVLAAIPTFLLFFFLQRHLVDGITMTGIK
jgi:multiple sugar transport system permease protein